MSLYEGFCKTNYNFFVFSVGNFKNKGVSSICIVAIEEICLKNQIVKEKEVIFIIVGLEIIYRSHQHVS